MRPDSQRLSSRSQSTEAALRMNLESESHYLETARAVLRIEIDELQRLADRIDRRFVAAVNALRDALEKGRKIVVIGVGKSENIATKIVATFNSTGAPSVMLNCQNALHGDIGIVSVGDALIALSYSGETTELLDLLPHLKRRAVKLVEHAIEMAVSGRPVVLLAPVFAGFDPLCCAACKPLLETAPTTIHPDRAMELQRKEHRVSRQEPCNDSLRQRVQLRHFTNESLI
jgi:glucosamine 6-phosphate synthetase-like amidotransferase/phosphosugar isomerase protein